MANRIILIVEGGCVQDVQNLPEGTEIEIRDYDIDGVDEAVLKEDSDGDDYQEIILTNPE